MKKTFNTALLIGLTLLGSVLNAQTSKSAQISRSTSAQPSQSAPVLDATHPSDATHAAKTSFIENQNYLAPSSLRDFRAVYADSLNGFDEDANRAKLLGSHVNGEEMLNVMKLRRRDFINNKYHIGLNTNVAARTGVTANATASRGGRQIGGNNTVNSAPCVNEGFESTPVGTYTGSTNAYAVQGWSLYSYQASGTCGFTNWQPGTPEAWIRATPITGLPGIMTLPNSPLGGSKVLQLNDNSPNGLQSRVVQTFPVTSANTLFQFAYAGAWDDGGHNCCEQPCVKIGMYDCTGAPLTCSSLSLNAQGPSCASGGQNATFTVTGTTSWTNWQVKYIDLTPFVGSCVTIEFINGDCIFGGHYGMLFMDCQCGGQVIGVGLGGVGGNIAGPVSYCAGSGQAVIAAPLGYASYQWISPTTGTIPAYLGGTAPTLSISNPVPGSVYTVNLVTGSGCFFVSTNVIQTSTIQIVAIGANSTCINGSSGTATVVGNGSGTGYTYSWQNSTGSVVGTSSMVTGLGVGIYSVTLGGLGVAGCGVATTTVQIGVTPTPTSSLLKPYCGSTAYLAAPNSGTGFQWYNNSTPIAFGSGGNSSSITVNNPCNGCIYWLSYNSSLGCHDSIKFTMYPAVSGALSIPDPGIVCPGGTNGVPTIVLQPAPGSPSGLNGYTVTGTSGNTYSSVVNGVANYTYNPTGLSAGLYNVNAFDGSCYYSSAFVVPTMNFNFSLSPPAYTLCSGSFTSVNMVFPSPPQQFQYIYSWSPSTFLSGTAQNVVIVSPTVAPGSTTTVIYTVTATSTLAMCPVSHTLPITVINAQIPSFQPILNMCDNHAPVNIVATPAGGTFVTTYNPGTLIGATSGVITPSNALQGTNTFTYNVGVATGIGNTTCKAASIGTFQVSHYNTPLLTGSIQPICVTGGTVDLMGLVQNTATGVWTGSGVSGGSGSYIFNPAALQTSTYTLTYSTQSQPNPTVCPDFSTMQVAVTNTLHPTITTPTLFCNNRAPFAMTASPSGGGWTGAGIPNNGSVTPSQLSSGSIFVTYTVAVGACINSANVTLNVSQFNSAALTGAVPNLCATNNPFDLSTISQNAGTWTGMGTSLSQPGFLNPAIFPPAANAYTTVLTHSCVSTPNATLCPDSQTIIAVILSPATPTITQSNPLCSIGSTMQMNVSPNTGSWVPSQYLNASGVFNPLLALIGLNPVTYVIGNSTCSAQQTQYVSVEAFVAATITGTLPDQCSSSTMFNLTPFALTGGGSWSGPGIAGASFDPSSVGSGVFTLVHNTSSSPSGLCPDQATVAVHVYSLQTPELSNIGPLCSAAPVALIHPNPPGGSFSGINTPAINPSGLFNPALAIAGINVVSYSITQGPCTAYAQATVTIEKFVSADIVSYPKPSYCKNNNVPLNLNQFVANPGGDWYGPGTTSNGMMTFANANIGNNNIVHYKVTSQPNGLCVDTSDIRINIIDVPAISITADPPSPGCAPYEVKLNMPNTNSVDGTILWDLGDGAKNTSDLGLTHTFTSPGTYSVVFTLAGSCTVQAVLAHPIVVVDKPKADFTVPAEVNTSNTEVQVNNLTPGSNAYQWQVSSSPSVVTGPSPSFMLPAIPGRYPITLTVKNIGGCTAEVTRVVEVKNEFNIFIPSSFTPNDDNLNDEFLPVFTPYGLDASTYEFEVFDRWGTSLFHTKDVKKGWNGTVQNKGTEALKEDVYVYKLRYKDLDGNVYSKIGHVTLVR